MALRARAEPSPSAPLILGKRARAIKWGAGVGGGREQSFPQMVPGQLNAHPQRNEVGPLTLTSSGQKLTHNGSKTYTQELKL